MTAHIIPALAILTCIAALFAYAACRLAGTADDDAATRTIIHTHPQQHTTGKGGEGDRVGVGHGEGG